MSVCLLVFSIQFHLRFAAHIHALCFAHEISAIDSGLHLNNATQKFAIADAYTHKYVEQIN